MKNTELKIANKSAIYHKLVFEVRYEQGLVYLDRCGRTANRIIATDPTWDLRGDLNPQNAPLLNVLSGASFNFNALKYDFSLDQPINESASINSDDIQLFTSQVETVSQIVHDELELKTFTREGFRVWFLFATTSDQESQEWITKLNVFQVTPNIMSAFSGKLESEGHVIVLRGEERNYRIAINPVERLEHLDLGNELKILPHRLPKGQKEARLKELKAKGKLLKNPGYAVMIDVDAYVEHPIEVAPADFIRQSLLAIEQNLQIALSGD